MFSTDPQRHFFVQSLSHHLSTLLIREPNVIPALTTEHTVHVVKSEIMQDWRDFLSLVFCIFVQEIFLKISCRFSVDFDYGYTNQVVALLFQIDVNSRISNNVDVYELITVDACQTLCHGNRIQGLYTPFLSGHVMLGGSSTKTSNKVRTFTSH